MTKAREITHYDMVQLNRHLDICTVTGSIRWKVPTAINIRVGDEAGTVKRRDRNRYRQIKIGGRVYLGHRIIVSFAAWLRGDLIPNYLEVDHIDGDGLNNRLENLRLVEHKTNLRNTRKHRHNTSGVTGVTRDKRRRKWQALIEIDGKNHYLGRFEDFNEAVAARREAEKQNGFTDRHGK